MLAPKQKPSQIVIEVFSASACNRCVKAKQEIVQLVEQLNRDLPLTNRNKVRMIRYQDIDVVDNIDRAVALGILTTPSIVINDQLIYTNMPPISDLKAKLLQLILLLLPTGEVNHDKN